MVEVVRTSGYRPDGQGSGVWESVEWFPPPCVLPLGSPPGFTTLRSLLGSRSPPSLFRLPGFPALGPPPDGHPLGSLSCTLPLGPPPDGHLLGLFPPRVPPVVSTPGFPPRVPFLVSALGFFH